MLQRNNEDGAGAAFFCTRKNLVAFAYHLNLMTSKALSVWSSSPVAAQSQQGHAPHVSPALHHRVHDPPANDAATRVPAASTSWSCGRNTRRHPWGSWAGSSPTEELHGDGGWPKVWARTATQRPLHHLHLTITPSPMSNTRIHQCCRLIDDQGCEQETIATEMNDWTWK